MNNENNNFSLIRNAEINRIGPNYISPIYYSYLNIHEEMKKVDAYEDEKYLNDNTNIWKRDPATYTHKYCNLLINNDYKTQYCIIGLDSLVKNIDRIKNLYSDTSNDFIVIDNKCSNAYLWKKIDELGFDKMKCYSLINQSEELLINYFKKMYLSVDNYEIISCNMNKISYNTDIYEVHTLINTLTNSQNNYLEIGIEYGHTFSKTHFINKVGVDPNPKYTEENGIIHAITSDKYFEDIKNNENVNTDINITDINITNNIVINETNKVLTISDNNFDVIYIDGMHHCENVLRDFNNSLEVINENGMIFISNILPTNYYEQLKVPVNHSYENGVLKYGEEWTGDVWKFIYHLLLLYNDKIKFTYFHNINYRGIICIQLVDTINIDITYDKINSYDYFENFNEYLDLLIKYKLN
jgi:hypothetical protein